MSNVIAAPKTDAAEPSRWLRVYLIVIAIVEGLLGLGKIPLLLAGDAEVPGKGWGGWAVTSELALTLPFALIALFFLVKSDIRRAIPFVAGIGLLGWISMLPSLADFPGKDFFAIYQVFRTMVLPLLMLMAIALCWKNERLTLAGLIAGIPSVLELLGIVIFAIGVAIYGF